MKKSKFLFVVSILILGINISFGQSNTVIAPNSNIPSISNVLIGPSGNLITNSGAGATGGYNVLIGNWNTASSITTGESNSIIGSAAGQSLTTGNENSFYGYLAGRFVTSGRFNNFFGVGTGLGCTTGNYNICMGSNSGNSIGAGDENVYIGRKAGEFVIGGLRNTLIGSNSGSNLTSGSSNTFLGFVQVGSTATTLSPSSSVSDSPGVIGNNFSGAVILADGGGNQRLLIDSNGFTGIGLGNNIRPENTLEVKALTGSPTQSGFVASGFRLASLPNSSYNTNLSTIGSPRKVLSTNENGDVILVSDVGGGVTNSCTQLNIIPKGNTAGNLSCSQIFDNTSTAIPITSSTVTIGYASQPASFTFTNPISTAGQIGSLGNPGTSFTLRLDVNGIGKCTAFYATSDKKFKKDIKPIENATSIVEKLSGKTYLWNTDKFKDKNFDNGGHSGFIAQELEEVLPHLVATSSTGEKAVNYSEIIPYLVEALKEQNAVIKSQQTQIDELKAQISDHFKKDNSNLIEFENTKIINVSPNPSQDVISISVNIEKSVSNANLHVYDLNGKLINNLIITDRDTNITKTLIKDNYGKGIYIVSLIINGKSIDSKKIIFN